MSELTTAPRIYVACLAAYNNGHLHGAWLDVDDVDTIQDGINNMLKASPIPNAEEWEIHDHEGLGSSAECFGDLEHIVELAEFSKEHGDLGEAVLSECCGDLDEAKSMMDNYHGEYESEIDFAYHIVEDCYTLEGPLANYFDYEAFARDLFMDGYSSIYVSGAHHVFSDR